MPIFEKFIQPETVSVTLANGEQKEFVLSKLPAILGREIATQYPTSAMPKVGDYKVNEALMLKLISHVAVKLKEENYMVLDTVDKVNNHVPEWEDLVRLEGLMLTYNFSFFRDGKGSTFFEGLLAKVKPFLIETLMDISRQSSTKEKQQ